MVSDMIKCPCHSFEDELKLLITGEYKWWDAYSYEYLNFNNMFRSQVILKHKRNLL